MVRQDSKRAIQGFQSQTFGLLVLLSDGWAGGTKFLAFGPRLSCLAKALESFVRKGSKQQQAAKISAANR